MIDDCRSFLPGVLVLGVSLVAGAGCHGTRGDGPSGGTAASVQPAPPLSANRAYVPSYDAGVISAIDLATNEVVWTLTVAEGTEAEPARAAMGMAATRDGGVVFTGDPPAKEVVVVDADARRVVKRIPVPHGVHAIDISPDDRRLWVGGRMPAYPWLSAISIIDTRTLEIVRTTAPALGNAAHFAFTPDGREVWAASISTSLVWVMDARTGGVLDAIPLVGGDFAGETPEGRRGLIGFNGIAVAPDGDRVFVTGPEPGTLFAIDAGSRDVDGSVRIGQRAHDVAVTRDGSEAWVANDVGTVTIVDAETLAVLDQLDMRRYADEETLAHVAFSPDGTDAYLSWEESVVVVDVESRQTVDVVPVPEEPHEISLEDYYVRP